MSDSMVKAQDDYEAKMSPIWHEADRLADEIYEMAKKGTDSIRELQDAVRDYHQFCDENDLEFDAYEAFEMMMNFNW